MSDETDSELDDSVTVSNEVVSKSSSYVTNLDSGNKRVLDDFKCVPGQRGSNNSSTNIKEKEDNDYKSEDDVTSVSISHTGSPQRRKRMSKKKVDSIGSDSEEDMPLSSKAKSKLKLSKSKRSDESNNSDDSPKKIIKRRKKVLNKRTSLQTLDSDDEISSASSTKLKSKEVVDSPDSDNSSNATLPTVSFQGKKEKAFSKGRGLSNSDSADDILPSTSTKSKPKKRSIVSDSEDSADLDDNEKDNELTSDFSKTKRKKQLKKTLSENSHHSSSDEKIDSHSSEPKEEKSENESEVQQNANDSEEEMLVIRKKSKKPKRRKQYNTRRRGADFREIELEELKMNDPTEKILENDDLFSKDDSDTEKKESQREEDGNDLSDIDMDEESLDAIKRKSTKKSKVRNYVHV